MAAAPAVGRRFFLPATVIMRGGGLTSPVVLSHNGAIGGDVSRDTIAIVYGSLRPHTPKDPARVRRAKFVEVAEFFGAEWIGWSSGRVAPPGFNLANHFSRIYLPRDGEPALWENPVVAPGGAQRAFYEISEPGLRALQQRGLKLH